MTTDNAGTRLTTDLREMVCEQIAYRELLVQMQRLRIVGEGGDEKIVGLGHRAVKRVFDSVAHRPGVEKASAHAACRFVADGSTMRALGGWRDHFVDTARSLSAEPLRSGVLG